LEDVWKNYIDCPKITKEILKELPDVALKEKRKLMVVKLKELFKCDGSLPKWIQNPEWPIKGNKPMIFREQKNKNDGCLYYFYDDEEEVIIEQFN
jgi:hypothetical protein